MPRSGQRLVKCSRVVSGRAGIWAGSGAQSPDSPSIISHPALLRSSCSLSVILWVTSLPLYWGGPQHSGTSSALLCPHSDPPGLSFEYETQIESRFSTRSNYRKRPGSPYIKVRSLRNWRNNLQIKSLLFSSECIHICVYMHSCLCLYISVYVCMYMHVYYIYTCVYCVYTHVCTSVCVSVPRFQVICLTCSQGRKLYSCRGHCKMYVQLYLFLIMRTTENNISPMPHC